MARFIDINKSFININESLILIISDIYWRNLELFNYL